MNHFRRIRRSVSALVTLAGALLVFGVTHPPPEPAGTAVVSPPPVVTHTVITGGMPGWQITLIAVGAALCAAVVAVLLDRALAARRHVTATAS
jgi:hypothetical protein